MPVPSQCPPLGRRLARMAGGVASASGIDPLLILCAADMLMLAIGFAATMLRWHR